MKRLLLVLCIIILTISSAACNANNTKPKPEISEETLTGSASIIERYAEIKDPEVIVEDDTIYFYIRPSGEEVSKEKLRQIGIDFMKALAGYTVDDDLKGPTEESYGEIYDYYNVEIIVEGERGTVLDKGTMSSGENEIKWQD